MDEIERENNSSMDRIYREAHMIRCEDLFCRKCERYFDSHFEFSEHVKEHIEENNNGKETYMEYIERHICSICGKSFEVISDLMIHYNTTCFDGPYTCKHCKKNCRSSTFLQVHLLLHHNYTEEMLRHAGFLTDINNTPSVTRYSVSKSFRRKAFQLSSSEEISDPCEATTSTNRKSRGIGTKRKDLAFNMLDKDYICYICNQSFSRKCVLDIHTQKHASPNIVKVPRQHFDRKTAVLKPSNVILGSSIWKKVERKKRGRPLKKTVVPTVNVKRKRKNKAIFGTNGQCSRRLKDHSQISDNIVGLSNWKNVKLSSKLRRGAISDKQKPSVTLDVIKKPKAGKTKSHKKKMKNGEKQMFICDLCKREFTDSYKLKRHYLIHTGERPYSCLKCKKTFARDDHLKRHMVKVCSKTCSSE